MQPNRLPGALTGLVLAMVAWGLPTGNLYIVALAIVPAAALMSTNPGKPRVTASVHVPELPVLVEEPFEVEVQYEIRGGRGLIQLHLPLGNDLELRDGTNLVVRRKRLGTLRGTMQFTARGHKRARHEFSELEWRIDPLHRMRAGSKGIAPMEGTLDVRPPMANFKRVPGGQMLSKDFRPQEDQASMGTSTTEFRDLRPYRRGDPLRSINWKATAKAMATVPPGKSLVPVVNEYEFEGQRGVWIFLDMGDAMKLGNEVDNAFERGVEAAQGLARFYLDRGMRVGFTRFNGPEGDEVRQFHPDHGSRQAYKITELLHGIAPTNTEGHLGSAVQQALPFIRGGRTFAIVIARAERFSEADFEALRQLRNATARRRGLPNVLLVNPDHYAELGIEEDLTKGVAAVSRVVDEQAWSRVRGLGVRLLVWDPTKRPLHAHMLRRRR